MSFPFLLTLIILLTLMVFKFPIWASIIMACVPYFLLTGVPLAAVTTIMASGQITSFILLAFPLFSLAGRLMNTGEVTKRIFDFANLSVGWIRGGLGQVNILASMLFAGMSGAAVADISGLGNIEIKGMIDKNYDVDFASGITLASSVLGPIIPPSTAVIIYCVISGESVLRMFLGGFLPGIIIAASLMLMVFIITKNKQYPLEKRPGFIEYLKGIKSVFLSMLTPAIILFGMFGGIFTPTEASSVAVVYAAFLGVVVYKNISLKRLIQDIKETAYFCSGIYAIVAASAVLSFIFTRENIGPKLAALITGTSLNPTFVIFLLLAIVLLLGCFIEVAAMMILILPVLIPIVKAVGYSPVAFGLIFILTATLGILTPPFGLGLYIGANITGLSFQDTVKSVTPFFIPLILVIIVMVFFPSIVTIVPNVILGN